MMTKPPMRRFDKLFSIALLLVGLFVLTQAGIRLAAP